MYMYEQRSLQASNVKHIANYNREQLRPKGDDIVYSHIKLRLNETKSQNTHKRQTAHVYRLHHKQVMCETVQTENNYVY